MIVDKNEQTIPFIPNSVQTKLVQNMCGRDIILKARQEGISSIVLAIFLIDFLLIENSRSVVIAHDKDSTLKLFERVKYYLSAFEQKTGIEVPKRYETKSELVNEKMNSYYYVGTAGSRSFGRSATLTNVHFSELAYYPEPEKIYLSASQAGTPKRIVIETTANGFGDLFSKMWHNAEEGFSNYKPHFFGWHDHNEYSAPDVVAREIELTQEERRLKEQYKLTNNQLAWRRQKMMEFPTKEAFMQEYPISPEEAFITSGSPVFDTDSLQHYKANKRLVKEPTRIGELVGVKPPVFSSKKEGYLKIWKDPLPQGQYVIGADPAEGVKGGDFSCAQVIDRKRFEQVAVWHGMADPDVFARALYKLGVFYNDALIAPERNSIGIACVLVLRELDYPNLYIREQIGKVIDKLTPELGWLTNTKTKPIIVSRTAKAIREKSVILHDEKTVNELLAYQYDDSGRANAPTGGHDDRVSALMIAIEMYYRTPLEEASKNTISGAVNDFSTYDPLEKPRDPFGSATSPLDLYG